MNIRTGLGFDVHAFEEGDYVMLNGVKIPFNKGLKAHSDGDVALHAITDAILGAIGERDIGVHFSDKDPKNKNMDSSLVVKHALNLMQKQNYKISNLDIIIVCEKPKINQYHTKMIERLEEILNIDKTQISIKGKTTEKLGFTGREEGIAVYATILIYK